MIVDKLGTKKAPYKLPELYFSKDKKGNPVILNGIKWFVFYSYINPATGKFKRFKLYGNINSGITASDRMDIGFKIIAKYTNAILNFNLNPFEKNIGNGAEAEISELTSSYILEKKESLIAKTATSYENVLTAFFVSVKDKHGIVRINDVTKDIIKSYMSTASKENNWGNKTYNEYLSQLGQFFRWTIDRDGSKLITDPTEKIKRRKVTTEANPPLDDDVLKSIITQAKASDPYFNFFFNLMYYTCFRPNFEARLLKIGYIDVRQMQIHIPASISKTGKKTGKGRSIEMSAQLLAIFKENKIIGGNPNHYIFTKLVKPGPIPVTVQFFKYRFNRIRKYLKLDPSVQMYAIKHTRVCHLVIDKVPLYRIQELTGHTTLEQLMTYLKGLKLIVDMKEPIISRDL